GALGLSLEPATPQQSAKPGKQPLASPPARRAGATSPAAGQRSRPPPSAPQPGWVSKLPAQARDRRESRRKGRRSACRQTREGRDQLAARASPTQPAANPRSNPPESALSTRQRTILRHLPKRPTASPRSTIAGRALRGSRPGP